MIYFIKFSSDGHYWRTFYAEKLEEIDDTIVAHNVQHPLPTFQGGTKGFRILHEERVEVNCSSEANVVFAYQVVKPGWFKGTC